MDSRIARVATSGTFHVGLGGHGGHGRLDRRDALVKRIEAGVDAALHIVQTIQEYAEALRRRGVGLRVGRVRRGEARGA